MGGNQAELADLLHATCFSPVKSNPVNNVKFSILPGLTAKLISTRLSKSEANLFGNLDQTRKTPRSKNSKHLALGMEIDFLGLAYPDTGKFYT